MSDPNTITYQAGAIEHATGTLQSASASLEQCKADLTNVNALLASHMGGQYHSAYQEAMLQIEQPLQHLAEVVGQHGQVLNSHHLRRVGIGRLARCGVTRKPGWGARESLRPSGFQSDDSC